MGAINYKTSDYITLAIKPYYFSEADLEEIKNEMIDCCGYSCGDEIIAYSYEDDYCNAEEIINDIDNYYMHIKIEPGYYEGLSIYIENNFPLAFDSWQDKRDAQKEITRIKKALVYLAGCGFVSCRPGRCTGYSDYAETLRDISEAIKEMRDEISRTPTWSWYNRDQHCSGF